MKQKMLIIGLTGSIGMGKSTAARIMNKMGFPIYDADQAVHDLMAKNGKAIKPIAKLFPESIKSGAVDRSILGRLVFGNSQQLKKLEAILHPLVRKAEQESLRQARQEKAKAIILEIPLLFETKANLRCDITICVTAPRAIQKARVLKRKGMTEAKYKSILKHQMSDAKKHMMADYVVQTGKGLADTRRQLVKILNRYDVLG